MARSNHLVFRSAWRTVNFLLVMVIVCSLYAGVREYSVRQYLRGFSDAVVPETAAAEQKVEAILEWMRNGPSRHLAAQPATLSTRDPETTLNYSQLLAVCGTATNAFLNLARSGGLTVRRLLLLTPELTTKHVVAEVLVDNRWVIVDPTYRVMMRDENGQLLTRDDLHRAAVFSQAISAVPGYPAEYNFERYAHVRISRLPLFGAGIRRVMDDTFPGWDESVDWSLLLERESFLLLTVSLVLTLFFLVVRALLAWYADRRLRIPRFHLREHFLRAMTAFFSTPEIKQ